MPEPEPPWRYTHHQYNGSLCVFHGLLVARVYFRISCISAICIHYALVFSACYSPIACSRLVCSPHMIKFCLEFQMACLAMKAASVSRWYQRLYWNWSRRCRHHRCCRHHCHHRCRWCCCPMNYMIVDATTMSTIHFVVQSSSNC